MSERQRRGGRGAWLKGAFSGRRGGRSGGIRRTRGEGAAARSGLGWKLPVSGQSANEAKMPRGSPGRARRGGLGSPPGPRTAGRRCPDTLTGAKAADFGSVCRYYCCWRIIHSGSMNRQASRNICKRRRRNAVYRRGHAKDGDTCNLWLNWRSSLGLVKINTVVDNEDEIQQQWM